MAGDGGGQLPQRGRQGETDCHTSDIGHWFAMTREWEAPADSRKRQLSWLRAGEAGVEGSEMEKILRLRCAPLRMTGCMCDEGVGAAALGRPLRCFPGREKRAAEGVGPYTETSILPSIPAPAEDRRAEKSNAVRGETARFFDCAALRSE